MRNIIILILFSLSVKAQTFTGLTLRQTTHSPYTVKGSTLTWPELDQNFYSLGDAIRALQAAGYLTGITGVQVNTALGYTPSNDAGVLHTSSATEAKSGILNITNTTSSTAITNGAFTVAGGVGISGSLFANYVTSKNYFVVNGSAGAEHQFTVNLGGTSGTDLASPILVLNANGGTGDGTISKIVMRTSFLVGTGISSQTGQDRIILNAYGIQIVASENVSLASNNSLVNDAGVLKWKDNTGTLHVLY